MTDDSIDNLSSLVGSAKYGNRASLEELVTLFHKPVFRMVFCRTGSRMDAEDITQDIFIQMSNKLHGLKDTSHFKSWLYRIALNRVRDFYRKKRLLSFFSTTIPVEDTEASGEANNPLDQIVEKEFWDQFHGLTRQLSRKEREVLLLRYVDELSIKEIAETLGGNESTVKTHLYRALKKFKQAPGLRSLLKGRLS
jgi:RNA polymerase sigma-70 factor (ECF subfamily)